MKSYGLLINSGCVIQKPDGEFLILPFDEAQKVFDDFRRKHKKPILNFGSSIKQ